MKPNRLHCLAFPLAAALALGACTSTDRPVAQQAAPAAAATGAVSAPEIAPDNGLAALVEQVQIPFETFTLDNGLTTIVHTDRKTPIVGVTVYYRVGSKHEPRGRTGFAHLFEHLMFGGSENVENFDIPLEAAGSTPTNGSTWYDRTNYVETVPTGALDLALFMESDRMGYLLGAVSQEKLDSQRGVVQNEKRQGDNQPYGLFDYLLAEELLPVGHPYRHATIGSMADLEAASLADVQQWFTDNYGPNNVVLALAGDIDSATARPMVERWFGDIPRGPAVPEPVAEPVTLTAPVNSIVADQVPQTAIYRAWSGPGLNHADAVPLQVGMHILGGLASSRLDNTMVRGDELAVSVSAYAQTFEQLSLLVSNVSVKDGVDRQTALAALNSQIALLLDQGPTQAELERAQTQMVAGTIGGLERVGGFGGKGMILAEGLMYAGDAAHYRHQLDQLVALTPGDVQAALQRWLSRPAYTLSIVPGERELDGATMGGWGDEDINPPPAPDAGTPVAVTRTAPPRAAPPIAPVGELAFPDIEHATLSNGVKVLLAQRDAIPQISMAMLFEAGSIVDPVGSAGVHETMMDLLTEGTTTRSALDIAVTEEQLGSSLVASAGREASTVYLTTLTTNLAPSIDLMADVIINPAFRQEDVARVRERRLAEIAQDLASPGGLANRAFLPLLYGADNPYAAATTSGNAQVVATIDRAQMVAEHRQWLRPDLATLTVVGDISMVELIPALEAGFAGWVAPASAAPTRPINRTPPAPAPRLVVIDRPNSPSSHLLMGRMTPLVGHADTIETIYRANEVLGQGFLSRLMGDLRETKGWTYGISSGLGGAKGPRHLQIETQVQADRTADSIRAIIAQLEAFPAHEPVTQIELQRVTDGAIRGLPNAYETNGQVRNALLGNQIAGRDIAYDARLPEIYRSITADGINAAAAQYLRPDNFTIVVVGDRSVIDAQLATLDQDIIYLSADDL